MEPEHSEPQNHHHQDDYAEEGREQQTPLQNQENQEDQEAYQEEGRRSQSLRAETADVRREDEPLGGQEEYYDEPERVYEEPDGYGTAEGENPGHEHEAENYQEEAEHHHDQNEEGEHHHYQEEEARNTGYQEEPNEDPLNQSIKSEPRITHTGSKYVNPDSMAADFTLQQTIAGKIIFYWLTTSQTLIFFIPPLRLRIGSGPINFQTIRLPEQRNCKSQVRS